MASVIKSLRIGPEKNLTYLIFCPKTGESALVDPSFECERVLKWVEETAGDPSKSVKLLLATHGHWDHAGGFPEMLKRLPQAQVVAHELEGSRLEKLGVRLDRPLKDGQEFSVGQVKVKGLHSPGHTEGGCCYLVDEKVLSGDTLFIDQCGRTDLPGGSDKDLFESLQKLKRLPPQTVVLPGHDYGRVPNATLAEQLETNPTLKARTLKEFVALP